MAMAATVKVVLGLIAFGVFWVLAVFPAVPFLPIGRTAGSLLGAMLMVVFQVLTPDQAYEAIDLSILGLLFGTMVVSIYLERAEMFKYLGQMLAWKSVGPRDLLCRICLITAIASALFTNDTCCVVLTEFVLKVARQHNLPPHPFLLALATSANIGSSATPIGNPQNLVIAIQSGISFGEFLIGILPAMLVGVVVNIIFLMCMYWKLLSSPQKDEEDATEEVVSDEDVKSHQFSPATMAHLPDSQQGDSGMETNPSNCDITSHPETLRNRVTATENEIDNLPISSVEPSKEVDIKGEEAVPSKETSSSPEEISEPEQADFITKCKRRLWKSCVYAITLAMLAALLAGLDMSWSTITAAIVLVVLDFKDARPCLDKVSYSLLVFFCGMFITVDGFNKTGIPTALWDKLEPYAHVTSVAGTTILSVVILVLSNLASNVPTVLLLGSRVAASAAAISTAEEKKAWLILAWVSTVAGNLSLLGSAANLIVCEQARGGQFPYNLSFWRHLKFGLPSTIIITAVGLTLIR